MRLLTHLSQYFAVFALILAQCGVTAAAELAPEEIVSRHLDSIASPDKRAAVKSRVAEGTLKLRLLVGGAGDVTGTWGRVSADRMSNFVMRFGNKDWRGEQFTYDGSKTGFAATTSTHLRSAFGQFIASQDFMVKEGLLGGELSTAWALQNLEANHARVESLGLKKVNGKELLGLRYFSKGTNDLVVKLYFDPKNYHHVLTVYSVEIQPHMTARITDSSSQSETRYTLEERFSDFQTTDGITLPTHYDLQWTQELQNGTTQLYDWYMTANQIHNNVPLDPANFVLK